MQRIHVGVTSFALLLAAVSSIAAGSAWAHPPTTVEEAPSTVNATLVEPSAVRELKPGEKIGRLFTLNSTTPYVLQRLTKRTYFFQRQFYGTTFYVGDKGVLLFDPLDARGTFLQQAIREVTNLPVTALVYSHNHADHIADAKVFVDAAAKAGVKLRIIASRATASKQSYLKSQLPKATETISWPRGKFAFEGLTVAMRGFTRPYHTDDHSAWLLVQERVLHSPDLLNPDQPPFWSFAGSENAVYYEGNLREAVALDWVYFNGGHGNVGSKEDFAFYFKFIGDLRAAVGKSLNSVSWGVGVDATKINAHTAFLPAWLAAVAKKATDELRPKYGRYYGFEASVPRNAEMMALTMYSYR